MPYQPIQRGRRADMKSPKTGIPFCICADVPRSHARHRHPSSVRHDLPPSCAASDAYHTSNDYARSSCREIRERSFERTQCILEHGDILAGLMNHVERDDVCSLDAAHRLCAHRRDLCCPCTRSRGRDGGARSPPHQRGFSVPPSMAK